MTYAWQKCHNHNPGAMRLSDNLFERHSASHCCRLTNLDLTQPKLFRGARQDDGASAINRIKKFLAMSAACWILITNLQIVMASIVTSERVDALIVQRSQAAPILNAI
jgi:hypothetical protein